MSRINQQWRAFNAWAGSLEPERGGLSSPPPDPPQQIDELAPHHGSMIGLVCPRCGGQVLRRGGEFACLQCGFEPTTRPPAAYSFEPHRNYAAESKLAMRPESGIDTVTVRVVAPPLAADVCVKCGRVADEGEFLRVHRCPECYLQYCADLRARNF